MDRNRYPCSWEPEGPSGGGKLFEEIAKLEGLGELVLIVAPIITGRFSVYGTTIIADR